jgi:ribose transport system substrate-binding protein
MEGKEMKRSIVLVLALLAVATIAMGAGQKEKQKGMLYYLAPNQMDEFQSGTTRYVQKFGKELGYEVRALNADNRAQVQMEQLDDAIGQGPRAIILNAVDSATIIAGVNKARAAGIPVLVYDRFITDTTLDFHSVVGTVKMGQMTAAECLKILKKKYNAEKGSILELMGDSGDMYTVLIDQGFRDSLKQYPSIKVVAKDSAAWDPTVAARVLDDQLTAGNKFDIVIMHSDARVTAITPVLEKHGYKAGDVAILGTDGSPTGLDQIRNGWMLETVAVPMVQQVWGMFQYIEKVIAKQSLPAGEVDVKGVKSEIKQEKWGPTLYLPGEIITKDNVANPDLWGNIKL